jgi:hypothetical protein
MSDVDNILSVYFYGGNQCFSGSVLLAGLKGPCRMKFVVNCALTAALLIGATSMALADSTKSDHDHGVDFSKYHTYSWGKVTTANPFYVERIKQAVDRSLQARGWSLVPSGGDATIFARDRIHNEQELETTYMGMGGGWGGGWGWNRWGGMGGMGGMGDTTTDTVDIRTGKLVIDVFDGKSKSLLWRGSASEDLSDNSGKNSKNLVRDINKLMKDFPLGKSSR